MRFKLIGMIILLSLTTNISFSAESLMDVYAMALKSDPTLKQSQINYDIELENKRQDFSRWLPNVTLSGDVTRNSQKRTYDVSQFDGEERYKSYGYSLSINQPLLRYENHVIYRQATDKINKANTKLHAARQNLIVRVSERYFGVLSALNSLRLVNAEKKTVLRQLEQAEGRFKAGLSSITAVYEAKAQRDVSIADEIEAKNQYQISLESLKEITDRYHKKLKPLLDSIELIQPEIQNADKWVMLALKNNVEVMMLQHENHQLRHEINRQRAGHYPTIDLVARVSKNFSGGGNFGQSETESRTIGLQFNLPIYQGGVVTSRTKTARLKYEKNLEALDTTMRSVKSQVHKIYLGLVAGGARIKSLMRSVSSNERVLNAVEAENKIGRRTLSDVFQANRNLYRAKRDYEQARYDYVLNQLRLKQSVGNLSESDLQEMNRWFAS